MDSGKVTAGFMQVDKEWDIKDVDGVPMIDVEALDWVRGELKKTKTERDEFKGKLEKLKQLLLLTDESVSDVSMNEVTARQWNAYLKEFPEEGL